ncbi:hypothetical protein Fcan01_24899 [Folsomia candida]|uniref:Uncharacterized protein n=1 Tax=Folsomia candida TaxID=158441 RepID=A0A226D7K5_FOLCA|nr:hypothetical protein Fcan01_24899 [Folsomia candida]
MKRMRLVSEIDFEKLQQVKNLRTNTSTSLNIPEESDLALFTSLPNEFKLKLYELLNRQKVTQDKNEESKPIMVKLAEETSNTNEKIQSIQNLELTPGMGAIPSKFLNKMHAVLRHLRANNHIVSWDEKGQLILHGILHEGTNITDLLNHCIRGISYYGPIPGFSDFLQILIEVNMPKTLVSKQTQKAMQTQIERNIVHPEPESIADGTIDVLYEAGDSPDSQRKGIPTPFGTPKTSKNSQSNFFQESASAIRNKFVNLKRGTNWLRVDRMD